MSALSGIKPRRTWSRGEFIAWVDVRVNEDLFRMLGLGWVKKVSFIISKIKGRHRDVTSATERKQA